MNSSRSRTPRTSHTPAHPHTHTSRNPHTPARPSTPTEPHQTTTPAPAATASKPATAARAHSPRRRDSTAPADTVTRASSLLTAVVKDTSTVVRHSITMAARRRRISMVRRHRRIRATVARAVIMAAMGAVPTDSMVGREDRRMGRATRDRDSTAMVGMGVGVEGMERRRDGRSSLGGSMC